MQDKKIIYLPIEIKAREYHAKTLFMLYAINAGYQVVMGSYVQLNRCIDMLPKGIYIGTSITRAHNQRLFCFVNKAGHKVVAFDEEGLIYYNKDNFIKNRINIDTINSIELFLTWGQNHSDLVRQKDETIKNYSQTGSMRFELLKPMYRSMYESQIEGIRRRYGDFILINTNLGMYNNFIGKDYYYNMLKKMVNQYDASDESFYRGKYLHQKEIFDSYKELISYLAALNPDTNIIVRPHPSERLSSWLDVKVKNVIVTNGGNIIPWILASKLVIQKNCTTAVESAYLDKPVITYSVSYDERFDNEITNELGLVCKTKEDVLRAISDLESIKRKLAADRKMMSYYVANMEEGENADLAIISELDNIGVDRQPAGIENFNELRLKLRLLEKDFRSFVSSIIKNSDSLKTDMQKFRRLSTKEFLRDIQKLCCPLGMDIKNIKVTRLHDKLYHINKAN